MIDNPDYVIGKDVITSDGYVLGKVSDMRYETAKWTIVGLKMKPGSEVSKILDSSLTKSMLFQPDKFVMNEVILTNKTAEASRKKITADRSEMPSVQEILGMKVLTSDALLVGTVDALDIDYTKWKLVSIRIKLDKNACPALGIKKGLIFSKKASGITMKNIASIGNSVILKLNTKKTAEVLVTF